MKRKVILLSTLLFFTALMPAFSAGKMRIVVMNLKSDGVPDRTARTVSNMLRTEFINLGEFIVVERAQMDAIMKEQGMQQTGCTDQECAVQIGRLMSARKIMVGEVSPMGKTIIMTVRIVDVERGVSEFAATQKAKSEDVLDIAVSKIARKIAARIRGESVPSTVAKRSSSGGITRGGYYFRGIIPGWGQIYADYKIKGFIYLGIFAATTFLTLVTISDYNTKKDDYETMSTEHSQDEYDAVYQDYEDAGKSASAFGIIFAAVYVFNWLDIFFLTSPNFGSDVGMLDKRKNFITFNTYKPSKFSNEKQVDFGVGLRF